MTRKSTVGRPRKVTDAQVTAILEWHRNRRTLKQLARDLNLSVGAIKYVIRVNGEYKQSAPEERTAQLTQRAQCIAGLRSRYLL